MIRISNRIYIDESEIDYIFTRSSGPGGQNVNKVSSGVQLRFNISDSEYLPEEVKVRLIRLAGKSVSREGLILINSTKHRSQHQNKQEALNKLTELIRRSLKKPLQRKRTGTPLRSKLKRLQNKKKRSEIKRLRKYSPG